MIFSLLTSSSLERCKITHTKLLITGHMKAEKSWEEAYYSLLSDVILYRLTVIPWRMLVLPLINTCPVLVNISHFFFFSDFKSHDIAISVNFCFPQYKYKENRYLWPAYKTEVSQQSLWSNGKQ